MLLFPIVSFKSLWLMILAILSVSKPLLLKLEADLHR